MGREPFPHSVPPEGSTPVTAKGWSKGLTTRGRTGPTSNRSTVPRSYSVVSGSIWVTQTHSDGSFRRDQTRRRPSLVVGLGSVEVSV